jgi:hypothetical protein
MPSTRTTDGGRTEPSFASVLESVGESSFWQYDGSESLRERGLRAPRGGPPVVRFTHPGTNATLEAEYRLSEETVCNLVLFTTLDPSLENRDSGFAESVGLAHHAIADKYDIPATMPHVDVAVPMTAGIPQHIGSLQLRSIVSAFSATALQIERLHRDICAPLKAYVPTPCRERTS